MVYMFPDVVKAARDACRCSVVWCCLVNTPSLATSKLCTAVGIAAAAEVSCAGSQLLPAAVRELLCARTACYMAWLCAGSAGAAARRQEAWEAQQVPVSPSCSSKGGAWPLGVRLCWLNLARWVAWAAVAGCTWWCRCSAIKLTARAQPAASLQAQLQLSWPEAHALQPAALKQRAV